MRSKNGIFLLPNNIEKNKDSPLKSLSCNERNLLSGESLYAID